MSTIAAVLCSPLNYNPNGDIYIDREIVTVLHKEPVSQCVHVLLCTVVTLRLAQVVYLSAGLCSMMNQPTERRFSTYVMNL